MKMPDTRHKHDIALEYVHCVCVCVCVLWDTILLPFWGVQWLQLLYIAVSGQTWTATCQWVNIT